ncbi:MAG TPA: hypothetical protein VFM00_04390 [Candidatus Eisenbacteria bacterium]|nr:hypothetical protein [Candidatus Eisenbacteria bacterium]
MTRPLARLGAPALCAALLVGFAGPPAAALPLYASREGDVCQTCHVDPNGGGIRNEFGFSYEKNRHSTEPEERWASMTVKPKLNDWITLGVDLRTMYIASHRNGGGRTLETSTFFPMDGQVNIAIMPHEHLTLVASQGLVVDLPGVPTGYVAREIYGMLEGLPGDAYVRVGRFRLPFGLRQDDHTSFVRSLDFLPYDSQKPDAGIEIGHVGAQFFQQISFTNGTTPFSERAQTVAAKAGIATRTVQAALSGFHRYSDQYLGGRRFERWALYLSATQGRATVLAEAAAGTDDFGDLKRNPGAMFAEMDYRLSRGVDLQGKFDYMDVDRGQSSPWLRRWTGEVLWNPVPFAQASLAYRYNDGAGGGALQEYLAQIYFPF